jgi:hypothetical protein
MLQIKRLICMFLFRKFRGPKKAERQFKPKIGVFEILKQVVKLRRSLEAFLKDAAFLLETAFWFCPSSNNF